MKGFIVAICLLSSLIPVFGQNSVFGRWKTIDDNTGEVKSIVEIYERDQKVFGKIVRIFPKASEDPDPVCDECDEDDPRYMKKIIGMVIMQHMTKDGSEYGGGEILDPKEGRVYRCRIWLEGDDLKVRGYWGPFYRTQTWKREP